MISRLSGLDFVIFLRISALYPLALSKKYAYHDRIFSITFVTAFNTVFLAPKLDILFCIELLFINIDLFLFF
ncbi:MAG: hypothetical protein K0Q74_208 [Gammaproteobacteria bacterium]|jgi:hypothetical protein|nr:hypothetical protein [Gammaproteobacteria bacterium]